MLWPYVLYMILKSVFINYMIMDVSMKISAGVDSMLFMATFFLNIYWYGLMLKTLLKMCFKSKEVTKKE